jgi:hypothetical protein
MLFALVLLLTVPPTGDEWTALPVPSLCLPARGGANPAPLWDARHVRLTAGSNERESAGSAPRLPIETLAQMLVEDARAHGARLELFRGTPALLARGDAAGIDAARARIGELERAAGNLEIELGVRLVPARDRNAKSADGNALAPGVARVASGDEAFFGARQSRGFVSGYSVEVAADSAVAQPVIGSALYGSTLHVRASRVEGGKRIHLSGVLDIAELVDISRFDPETPDLGVVQEPRIRCAQAIFSGVVESGGTLEVKIEASPLAQPDWDLTLQASTRPDDPPAEREARGWSLIDCAFLAADPPGLPPCRPGAGLEARADPSERGLLHPGLPPSAIAAALATESDGAGAAGQPMHWSAQALLVPNADPALVRAALDLARGVESLRLATGRVEIQSGKLRAELPVTEGFPARFSAGVERSFLIGYTAEIAPQTWISSPQVDVVLDGVCVEIDASSTSASCWAWSATSQAPIDVPRKDAQLGKLQVLGRSLRFDTARLVRDEPMRKLLPMIPAPDGREGEADVFAIAYRAR